MTDKPRNLSIQPSEAADAESRISVPTNSRSLLLVKSRSRLPKRFQWLSKFLAFIVLVGAASAVAGSIWISFQLLLYPDTVIWLNRYLPAWTKIPIKSRDPLLTLPEILGNIRQDGLIPGEIIPLVNDKAAAANVSPNLLILVLNPQGQIVELRVYQPERGSPYLGEDEKYFWPVSQIAIEGPQESFVIAPLVSAQSNLQGSNRSLPLTAIHQFKDGPLPPGIWFNLTGTWAQADSVVPYGTLVHYNPDRAHLSLMLQWASPSQEEPQWINLAGDRTPELLINQTVGLEPQYILQQIQPRKFLPNPIHLQPISLNEAVNGNRIYQNALVLARSGLWSPALKWFQSYQRQASKNPKLWNARVQAQLALVEIHAKVTTTQADKTWASPSDQVLVQLIDGRWQRALTLYEKDEDISEIIALLRSDTGRLRRRVNAALRVNPTQIEVQAWGALLVQARQGRARAVAWLQQQARISPNATARIYRYLDKLEASIYTANAANSSHISQIVGTAAPSGSINPRAWMRPDPQTSLQQTPGETWYQIQVVAFQDGLRWRKNPFVGIKLLRDVAAKQLWNLLGLASDPQILITAWDKAGEQQTATVTVKAVRLNGQSIQLLASGEPLPKSIGSTSKLLAYTNSAFQIQEPGTSNLQNLNQQQPDLTLKIWKAFLAELRNAGELRGKVPQLKELIEQEIGTVPLIQEIDLTGNQVPDYLITLDGDVFQTLFGQKSRFRKTKTLIFSDTGNLIYSEFGNETRYSLTTIVDINDGGTSALILEGPNGFNLWRWVQKKRRFE